MLCEGSNGSCLTYVACESEGVDLHVLGIFVPWDLVEDGDGILSGDCSERVVVDVVVFCLVVKDFRGEFDVLVLMVVAVIMVAGLTIVMVVMVLVRWSLMMMMLVGTVCMIMMIVHLQ